MVLIKERVANTGSSDDLTDREREVIERTKADLKRIEENIRSMIIVCPQDGSDAKFVRYDGGYTRVVGVFRCAEGHEIIKT